MEFQDDLILFSRLIIAMMISSPLLRLLQKPVLSTCSLKTKQWQCFFFLKFHLEIFWNILLIQQTSALIFIVKFSILYILYSKFHMCFSHTHTFEDRDTYISVYIQKKNNINNDGTRISPAHFFMSNDIFPQNVTKSQYFIFQT